jgi:iron complex transport system ATP-binding protein
VIEARALTLAAGPRRLLDGVTLALRPGEVLAVIGPNGAGKSTLLRALSGELRPRDGEVAMLGRALRDWPPAAMARCRAVVSQQAGLAFPMRVAEVVALGRLPWAGTAEAARDREAVSAAMAMAGVAPLATQAYATLSGGERQRVQVARALAQLDGAARPAALLLDEPTASLDVRHAAALLAVLRRLAGEGLAVLVVLHDLNEAAFVADRVAVMQAARCVALGPPRQVLRPDFLEQVYGLAFHDRDGALVPAFG